MGPRTVLVPRRVSKHLRIALGGLVFAVVTLAVAVGFLAFWVLDLKTSRDGENSREQQRVNVTICQVVDSLRYPSPALSDIRTRLHCEDIP